MLEINKVEKFETSDNRIFNTYEQAFNHITMVEFVKNQIELLGGSDRDICPESSSYTNGKRYVLVNVDNVNKAHNLLREKLTEIYGCHISSLSHVAYDTEYFGDIARVLNRIGGDLVEGKYLKRYAQAYYVSNQQEAENFEIKRVD